MIEIYCTLDGKPCKWRRRWYVFRLAIWKWWKRRYPDVSYTFRYTAALPLDSKLRVRYITNVAKVE